ncbi:hypothetical protein HDU93_003785 [Gonapodya sp. JEL0774]|nr:hypothetical protein HDU93_003785 [Gonapodya sp. JEL0774]
MPIFKSKHPDIEIPDVDIFNFIFPSSPDYSTRAAFVDGVTGERISYKDLQSVSEDFAAALQGKYGLKEQEVLALFSPNDLHYPIALWGALRIGAIATTVNNTYTTEELVYQLRDAGARVLLTHSTVLSTALEAARIAGIPTDAILLFSRDEGDLSQRMFPTIKELLVEWGGKRRTGDLVLRNFRLGKEAKERIAFLCYSSGTTGRSKGVMISHRNVVANHPAVDQVDTSSVRIVWSAAAPLPWETVNQLKRRKGFRNIVVQQGFGMTESATAITITHTYNVRPGSIGEILPNIEVKIVDPETQKELDVEKEGEIWVRGPNITLGYLNNKKATDETYRDGWLLSGDLGVVDKDQHCYIRDRLKEMIKVKGLQVAPAELEALLVEHPAVADACVVQIPDERRGEMPRAYVVLKPSYEKGNHDAIKKSIHELFQSRLARHKQLAGGIVFIQSIPKNPSGKLLRRVLRERAKHESAVTPKSSL